jgi:hypothetical protein
MNGLTTFRWGLAGGEEGLLDAVTVWSLSHAVPASSCKPCEVNK